MRANVPNGGASLPRRPVSMLVCVACALVVAGAALATFGRSGSWQAAAPASAHAAAAPVHKITPLIPESSWGKWLKQDLGRTFPTNQTPFSVGQTVVIPGDVSIRVDEIDRNWAPQPWQQSSSPVGDQDDATGKEIILIRFTITNLGSQPLSYNDDYFGLVRANGHEQRVAALAELTGDQYGSFAQPNPWLEPGVTKHSFVPFLVSPGEQPREFVFYRYTLAWNQQGGPSTITTGGTARQVPNAIPVYEDTARVSFALSTSGVQSASVAGASRATFAPDSAFRVTTSQVYSPTPA